MIFRRCNNPNRCVDDLGEISRKKASSRPDLVLLKDNIEFGCSELGKIDDPSSTTKVIIETQLHSPKTMKDMFCMVAECVMNDFGTVHHLKIVCFHNTALRMKMGALDSPDGYVCRVLENDVYQLPKNPNLVYAELLSTLQLTFQSKIFLEYSH
ncbi:hypothetical protein BDA99DRAFT_535997 [Phascolomyces articulosus]|uniref:Uncharacterized protein n=1 Tax=Phascolomyces articulosus TaxID=60185 RepID=A0AAD5PF69_9FUNG|nr:hypothetical protein BDA99DRAFT_535997 [Phascolomyces articulosus]